MTDKEDIEYSDAADGCLTVAWIVYVCLVVAAVVLMMPVLIAWLAVVVVYYAIEYLVTGRK